MKICTSCKIEKNNKEFGKRTNSNDGLQYICKICKHVNDNNNYKLNKDYKLQQSKQYYIVNKKIVLKKRQNNANYKNYNKLYKQENKDDISAYNKQYRELNKEKIKNQRAKYRKENRPKIREYENNKIKTDILFRLSKRLRNRLRDFINSRQFIKDKSFNEYIGCSLEELKQHIEKQFQEGMTWENYGKWELDHIYPLSLAKTEEELYKLCHYLNLQPLWRHDNIKKSNKVE